LTAGVTYEQGAEEKRLVKGPIDIDENTPKAKMGEVEAWEEAKPANAEDLEAAENGESKILQSP
jgi:hypothetical protein